MISKKSQQISTSYCCQKKEHFLSIELSFSYKKFFIHKVAFIVLEYWIYVPLEAMQFSASASLCVSRLLVSGNERQRLRMREEWRHDESTNEEGKNERYIPCARHLMFPNKWTTCGIYQSADRSRYKWYK